MAINKAIIIGYLGQDPKTSNYGEGGMVANFSVATTEKFDGKEVTEWHQISAFGKLADVCSKYLTKGKQVYVEGKLQTREYTDKEQVTRKATSIVAQRVEFLSSANNSGPKEYDSIEQAEAAIRGKGATVQTSTIDDDDIPF